MEATQTESNNNVRMIGDDGKKDGQHVKIEFCYLIVVIFVRDYIHISYCLAVSTEHDE